MSKDSFHVTQPGDITGLGDALKKCALKGSPVGIVYSLNGNLKPTLVANSPMTQWIYRRQSGTFNRLPGDWYVGDPIESATNWLTVTRDPSDRNRTLMENWALNPADYYDPLNEPVIELQNPNDPAQVAEMVRRAQWTNTWMVTALNITNANGFKLALFSFPTGSPPLQVWSYLQPSLRLGKLYKAVLSLHEYGLNGTLQASTNGNALRYREVWKVLPADCKMPIVITECSGGMGYDTGLSGQEWVDDMAWYDSELMKDPYVLGGCAFQLGGQESNLQPALDIYSDYIATHPTPIVIPPDPEPDPSPVKESPNGTTVPPSPSIIASPLTVWRLGARTVHGYALLKNGVQFAGGQGVLLLYYNKLVYTQNDLKQWFVATEIEWKPVNGDPRPSIGVTLNVPWVGQNTVRPDDDYTNSDCGPASVTMWLRYRNRIVSVDDVSRATGKPKGYTYTVFADLDRAANVYGLNLKHEFGTLTLEKIRSELKANRPVLALVHYSSLLVKWSATYTLSHWIIVTGYNDRGFYYNDPYWPDIRGEKIYITSDRLMIAMYNVTQNGNTPNQGAVEELTTPLPQPTITKFGLGAGTQDEIPQSHTDLYGSAFGTDPNAAFKFLTLPDPGAMSSTISKIKAKNPNAFLLARLFFSVGNTPFTAQDFVDYSQNGTAAAYASGIRDFEVHNEPNLSQEGLGLGWSNGAEFGNWLKQVIGILKPKYPDARWWFPGLSPNDAAPKFIADALSTGVGALLHGYCFHSYWTTETGGQYNMMDETGGLSWKKLWRVLPASEQKKPVSITEFSNNYPDIPPDAKGKQYRRYRSVLGVNGVHSAFSFVLYWAYDDNAESWCLYNGTPTGISTGYTSG